MVMFFRCALSGINLLRLPRLFPDHETLTLGQQDKRFLTVDRCVSGHCLIIVLTPMISLIDRASANHPTLLSRGRIFFERLEPLRFIYAQT